MKTLFQAARPLLSDFLATLVFAAVAALTHNATLASGLAIAAGVAQAIFKLVRREPIPPLQWASLGLVIVFGGATLITHDARFMMFKPTLIYAVVGATMLQRGWMVRYIPPRGQGRGAEPLFVG